MGHLEAFRFGDTTVHAVVADLPPEHMKTYSIKRPRATHSRPASCEDVDCEQFRHGWVTTVDETTELGQRQAHYIRHDSTRAHREQRGGVFGDVTVAENLTCFLFAPGTRCFKAGEHRAPLERTPLYVVRGGDLRGNPRQEYRQHKRQADWVDDFATHQDGIAAAIQKG